MNESNGVSRWRFAARMAGMHALISLVVAAVAASVVFWVWYPDPWWSMLGVVDIFPLIVLVDVVCGPLLTAVIASPSKSRRATRWDLTLIGVVQLVALCYGMWSVYVVRPVALVYEVDRFQVVTASEVVKTSLPDALPSLRKLPYFGLKVLTVRDARDEAEYLSSLQQAIEGTPRALRPNWWLPFLGSERKLLERAHPIEYLMRSRPAQQNLLQIKLKSLGKTASEVWYLPLVSGERTDWVVLLSSSAEILGYAPVDGFN